MIDQLATLSPGRAKKSQLRFKVPFFIWLKKDERKLREFNERTSRTFLHFPPQKSTPKKMGQTSEDKDKKTPNDKIAKRPTKLQTYKPQRKPTKSKWFKMLNLTAWIFQVVNRTPADSILDAITTTNTLDAITTTNTHTKTDRILRR